MVGAAAVTFTLAAPTATVVVPVTRFTFCVFVLMEGGSGGMVMKTGVEAEEDEEELEEDEDDEEED